jgi:GT2 family glycosyltransferase
VITIAIPTYNRGAILVETIERLLALTPPAEAIVIADQTREHPPAAQTALERWSRVGSIVWLRLAEPSIPRAMNDALAAATTPLVLFLDDDIIPDPRLAGAHIHAHRDEAVWAVAGQVLQPGEEPGGHSPRVRTEEHLTDDLEFAFNSSEPRFVTNVMAGNLSVKRQRALQLGGFDENFIGAAYRFETDFAMRVAAAGGRVWFEPSASIRHLKLASGGLRSYGDHRAVAAPTHTVGDYYFALHHMARFWPYAGRRIAKNVLTRFHATHPWTIPAKLAAELRGIALAKRLYRKGRRLRDVAAGRPLP